MVLSVLIKFVLMLFFINMIKHHVIDTCHHVHILITINVLKKLVIHIKMKNNVVLIIKIINVLGVDLVH